MYFVPKVFCFFLCAGYSSNFKKWKCALICSILDISWQQGSVGGVCTPTIPTTLPEHYWATGVRFPGSPCLVSNWIWTCEGPEMKASWLAGSTSARRPRFGDFTHTMFYTETILISIAFTIVRQRSALKENKQWAGILNRVQWSRACRM